MISYRRLKILYPHRSDCEFMDNIHTSAAGNTDDLGMRLDVGDVDFYPNNGHQQPGCGDNPSKMRVV